LQDPAPIAKTKDNPISTKKRSLSPEKINSPPNLSSIASPDFAATGFSSKPAFFQLINKQ
jgi:hypothetical protein